MPTEKRSRSIRLKELKANYLDELRKRCAGRYDSALQRNLLTQGEMEGMIWEYYRKTSPSLQEFYSRYTPEWEAFYEHESLPPVEFIGFLQRMLPAFGKRYSAVELDVAYYVERMKRSLADRKRLIRLQQWFLDKWYKALTDKEYDYQYHHIDSLCQDFVLLKGDSGLVTRESTDSRVRYLLLNHPELYKQVVTYEKEMGRSRQIRQLVEDLGRNGRGEKSQFHSLSGVLAEQLVRQSVRSDIEGIGEGDDLNHLLPIEYGYLADKELYPSFVKRYAEKHLQVFDCRSVEDWSVPHRKKLKVGGQGPYIVCIDTSASMNGRTEVLAKSALLAIAMLTEKTHRKCVVINFSEEITTLVVRNLCADMPMLVDFLNQRFNGGTNLSPAIDEAIRLIGNNEWKRSDVVWISDFEMPPLSEEYEKRINHLKSGGTSFYALVFGSCPEMDYLNVCNRYWEMPVC